MSLKAAFLRQLGDRFLRQEWSEYQGKQAKKATRHDGDGGIGDLNPQWAIKNTLVNWLL